MNVLFLIIGSFQGIEQHEIYPDLARKFYSEGHNIFVVCCNERRKKKETELIDQGRVKILRVKIGNITRCNIIEKGLSTVLINFQFKQAISKFLANVRFDLVIYATPPITLYETVRYVKNKDLAKTYLMLKDIFPQNAIDIGILSMRGIKGIITRYFRVKEKQLYAVSDFIGCMSDANCRYLLSNNPEISESKVEVCPNCFEIHTFRLSEIEKRSIKEKYCIPDNKIVLVYGGSLGKPQGISFFLECLSTQKYNQSVFFLIIGEGTEFNYINSVIKRDKYQNVVLYPRIPSEDYDKILEVCDCGLVFLDHRFSIPNYPSRILPYMQASLPILACTDTATDLRDLITDNEMGWWCESNDPNAFSRIVDNLQIDDLKEKGKRSFDVLRNRFDVAIAYKTIIKHL